MSTIGIIGGTGVYALPGLTKVREIKIDTPFGAPSDLLVTGELEGVQLVFIPRHGRGHRLLPTEVPYRANVFALKSLGVTTLVSVSAVGSMKESIHPGHLVVPDQYIDYTRARAQTFFGEGLVAHVSMAAPVCPSLAKHLGDSAQSLGLTAHRGGTYLCIEGPAFSSRAESMTYRALGVSVIGMTAMPEAKLAREAELHYATVAVATDFDCWHQTEEAVSVDSVMATLRNNAHNVQKLLLHALRDVAAIESGSCTCTRALAAAITTDRAVVPDERIQELAPLIGKYLR